MRKKKLFGSLNLYDRTYDGNSEDDDEEEAADSYDYHSDRPLGDKTIVSFDVLRDAHFRYDCKIILTLRLNLREFNIIY